MSPNESTRNLILAALLAAIVYSGFAYPLHYGTGFWPWNRDWFMFSWDPGMDYELEALGEKPDGTKETLRLENLFRFPIAAHSNRFQEIPREMYAMGKAADYLCRKFPEYKTITILDHSWPRIPGKRLKRSEAPVATIKTETWMAQSCL